MKLADLEMWIREKITSLESDIKMDEECKAEGRPIPFGDDNEKWVNAIKECKEALLDVIAHIEVDRLNQAYHLSKVLEDIEPEEEEKPPGPEPKFWKKTFCTLGAVINLCIHSGGCGTCPRWKEVRKEIPLPGPELTDESKREDRDEKRRDGTTTPRT